MPLTEGEPLSADSLPAYSLSLNADEYLEFSAHDWEGTPICQDYALPIQTVMDEGMPIQLPRHIFLVDLFGDASAWATFLSDTGLDDLIQRLGIEVNTRAPNHSRNGQFTFAASFGEGFRVAEWAGTFVTFGETVSTDLTNDPDGVEIENRFNGYTTGRMVRGEMLCLSWQRYANRFTPYVLANQVAGTPDYLEFTEHTDWFTNRKNAAVAGGAECTRQKHVVYRDTDISTAFTGDSDANLQTILASQGATYVGLLTGGSYVTADATLFSQWASEVETAINAFYS